MTFILTLCLCFDSAGRDFSFLHSLKFMKIDIFLPNNLFFHFHAPFFLTDLVFSIVMEAAYYKLPLCS